MVPRDSKIVSFLGTDPSTAFSLSLIRVKSYHKTQTIWSLLLKLFQISPIIMNQNARRHFSSLCMQ